ncbi:hypothetical protein [Cyanobium sp. Lug-B]|uniref:hypothetical protein n=1 Tax=Cyanobium sp. Lug-B TaxID=2823716 RepID=UPI0020CBDCFA|nr:hypothetical protein [Cyanobium sp. Lug-B]MCP9797539.1 hypothetical protein [Cyanobium sp. Lug-B]
MVSRSSLPSQPPRTAGQQLRRRLRGPLPALLLLPLLAAGCQGLPNPESRRIDQLELKIQQLEQRLNKADLRPDTADPAGKPPAGVVKSLTLRTDTEDDRLRIYWADGSRTDLPCTKEQTTLVCG